MDSKMDEIIYQRDLIQRLSDERAIYRFGFYITAAGWIVTVVGFIILAF